MTYTFYCPAEGRHIIYDTESGAVIRSTEIEAYICDALDPCGEELSPLPEKCPSEIRYELARFASTEVSAAYEKIKSSLTFNSDTSDIYFHALESKVDNECLEMIKLCEKAKKDCFSITFDYKSLNSNEFNQVELCPYEVLNIKMDYYVLGYNRSKSDFRFYKFSSIRMKNMKLLNKRFTRDLDFKLNTYLGKSGLMKDEILEVEFKITGKNAILYSERSIGVNSITKFENNELYVKTIFEGKMNALQFLCSLGSSCILLSPSSLKEELKEEIRKMMENYF